MSDGTNIFNVIKGLSFLLARDAPSWFTGINTLQDAESTEVLDCHLQHLETLGSSDKACFEPSVFFLLLFPHTGELSLRSHLGMARRLDRLLLGTSFHAVSHGAVFDLSLFAVG